uniref:Uncharacterized protein n=1 Tax=Arundo donax TaxID=35708 RepID=A0A0A9HS59_ARUDO
MYWLSTRWISLVYLQLETDYSLTNLSSNMNC